MSYTCICAGGHNGATLHYGHAGEPNAHVLKDGDIWYHDDDGDDDDDLMMVMMVMMMMI